MFASEEENECVRAWFDTRFGDDFVPVPFEAHWPLAPDDVTGDVDEGDVARDDVDEDGNAMDDGTVAPSHGFALRPDLHGCERFLRRSGGFESPSPGGSPGESIWVGGGDRRGGDGEVDPGERAALLAIALTNAVV